MTFETIEIQDLDGSQLIKLPSNFKINDDKVYLKKVGDNIYIIPFHNPWQSLKDSLEEFSDDFMDKRNQSGIQTRESLD